MFDDDDTLAATIADALARAPKSLRAGPRAHLAIVAAQYVLPLLRRAGWIITKRPPRPPHSCG